MVGDIGDINHNRNRIVSHKSIVDDNIIFFNVIMINDVSNGNGDADGYGNGKSYGNGTCNCNGNGNGNDIYIYMYR